MSVRVCHAHNCQVMRVATKEKLSDELKWVKFSSIAWTHDHKGFFYQVRIHSNLIGSLWSCDIHHSLQRFPEPETKSAGTETNQVLHHKVSQFGELHLRAREDVV